MRKLSVIVVIFVAAAGTAAFALTLSFERTWGGPNIDNGTGVAVAPSDRSVYVAGTTASFGTGTADGNTDAFLLKFAANGAVAWQRTWGRREPNRSPRRTSSLSMSLWARLPRSRCTSPATFLTAASSS